MTSDRPKLGAAFRTPPPDRTAGLVGLLPTPPDAAETQAAPKATTATVDPLPADPPAIDPVSSGGTAPADAPPDPADAPGPARRRNGQRRQGATTPTDSAADPGPRSERRIASIALDASVLGDLRTFAARTEQTHGAVVLRAIEANADALASHWARPEPADPTVGRLFAGTPAIRRRSEPVVQTQIRLLAADMDTLDTLVEQWAAPSRSALVNEALDRYVRLTPDAQ